jgi:putative SOS response-associated peptidase YedK
MCGRFMLVANPDALADQFGLAAVQPLEPRYNVAPTQEVFAIRTDSDSDRQGALLRWGLISWADDPKIGYRMICGRLQFSAWRDRPARSAFRSTQRHTVRRCSSFCTGNDLKRPW